MYYSTQFTLPTCIIHPFNLVYSRGKVLVYIDKQLLSSLLLIARTMSMLTRSYFRTGLLRLATARVHSSATAFSPLPHSRAFNVRSMSVSTHSSLTLVSTSGVYSVL